MYFFFIILVPLTDYGYIFLADILFLIINLAFCMLVKVKTESFLSIFCK